MVDRWDFYLHSLDTIATHETNLSIFLASGEWWFSKFESDKPLNLWLDIRVLCIELDVCDVQTSQWVARGISACVDTLHFLESNVALRCFFHQRSIVTWSLHSMRNIWGVSQFIAGAYRVKESDCLIGWGTHEKLNFLKVANVNNRSIMCIKALIDRHYPRWVSLEQLDHVFLDVPDNDFRFEVTVLFTICMPLIHCLGAFLEFMW